MDPRLFDPKNQLQIAQALTSNSAISRLEAMRVLKKNGVDVEKAVAAAEQWKASGAKFVPMKPPPSPLSLKSAPHLPEGRVKEVLLALATGSLIDKLEARRYCQKEGVSVDELRELARDIAGPAPNPGS